MFSIYRKRLNGSTAHYEFVEESSLFGCRAGKLCEWLAQRLPLRCADGFWHLDVASSLAARGMPEHAFLIDVKPKSKNGDLSLYELLDVWGHSHNEWTPVMLRLRGLFVDATRSDENAQMFSKTLPTADEPIFTFTYIQGWIEGDKLRGTWTSPPSSSTNSALLWPKTFAYFLEESQRFGNALQGV